MSESRFGSGFIWGAVALVLLVGVALVFTPLRMVVGVGVSMVRVRAVERRMQRPEMYQPAATNLALYFQSIEQLQLTNYPGASCLPQPLPSLGTPWARFESNFAHIEFGGGFYHYGYRLFLNEAARANNPAGLQWVPTTNIWEIVLCREGSPDTLLRLSCRG
jgi:hypothetical protein